MQNRQHSSSALFTEALLSNGSIRFSHYHRVHESIHTRSQQCQRHNSKVQCVFMHVFFAVLTVEYRMLLQILMTSSLAPDFCLRALGLFVAFTLLHIYQLNKLNGEERGRARGEMNVPSASTSHKGKMAVAKERTAAAPDSWRVKWDISRMLKRFSSLYCHRQDED